MATKAPPTPPEYPTTLAIDYPDRALNRLTTFFRIFVAVPIAIILFLVSSGNVGLHGMSGWSWLYSAGGILFLAPLLMILFRQKYPRWWFDWNVAWIKFSTRVSTYLGLLTDVYPSTDEEQSVHIEITYPDVPKDLNRWLPLVKWFLAIPHYIILAFLGIAAFDFVVGVYRWSLRVITYAVLLTTDRYPLFSLD
jgi:hypothetical protein